MHMMIMRISFCAEGVFCLDRTVIAIGSVTYAIKARRVLSRNGIQSKLVKIDALESHNGCTHGLEIDSEDFYATVMGLRNAGISYSLK